MDYIVFLPAWRKDCLQLGEEILARTSQRGNTNILREQLCRVVLFTQATPEDPKQDDPAGMLSKLCSGYRNLSQLLVPSEGK